MGGGLMQLVAYGAQDVYLTGNAQITFFKVVYRRHTNFAIEMNELPIDIAKPGGQFTVQILRNGDLCTRMYLHLRTSDVTVANVSPNSPNTIGNSVDSSDVIDNPKIAFVRRLGHAAIGWVKVQVGGTDIDEHYGIWLDLWYELTHLEGQTRGYRKLIGDIPELTTLRGADISNTSNVIIPSQELFIPLQFWFNRNPGLALPLIALQYHDVRLYFWLTEAQKLFVWSGDSAPLVSQWVYQTAGLLVDYIYLDADERRRFAQVGHEYLIEQNQEYDSAITGNGGATQKNNFILQFNHPCKEFVFANKCGSFSGADTSRNTFLCYSSSDLGWAAACDYAAANVMAGAIYTGRGALDGTYYRVNTSYLYAKGSTTAVTLSPLLTTYTAVKSSAAIPAGTSGVSTSTIVTPKNNTIYITISVNNQSSTSVAVNDILFYVNTSAFTCKATDGTTIAYLEKFAQTLNTPYAQVIANITINAVSSPSGAWANGDVFLNNVAVTGHALDIKWASLPVCDAVSDARFSRVVLNVDSSMDVHVIQPNNYGIYLDGTGNVVNGGYVKLNGQQRFDWVSGNYFNYVQPYQHHTRTPADGINVYSFALNPETHQPSGTANLSRIDTTELYLSLGLPNSDRLTNIAPYPAFTNWVTSSTFYVFTQNYNVFRIMSGMGGLAYSN